MTNLDIAFEGAYLRSALLVGLVHEQEVPEWAAAMIGVDRRYDGALSDVLPAPMELTAMREARRPDAGNADDALVVNALLTTLAYRIAPGVADTILMLR